MKNQGSKLKNKYSKKIKYEIIILSKLWYFEIFSSRFIELRIRNQILMKIERKNR